ncbi:MULTISPECIES: glycoside hydrolase family 13 protein [Rhizobium]|uniref:glycoside hydrolase family 13 protein n=1 Tax=Rhizobium TaxID=379 RepID=UPI0007EAEA3C|nr:MULTISPECIES: alpha-glucosidase [Rhizobium]ANK86914.1 oligo-1,6-glucosidase [Rhizobium sp. N731]ANK92869.1 oligo-1,6-glucosidase [Rhizobium sp. N6212]ANK98915.1 oligo-1,6-glucosidase [Rhizobium sp. N621]ANL05043.1 oligo-1,6-glucosidase [Rhizobium esperanzae]ANL11100.1 oligo-1,6-glucosidase [Rhizobium sp. N1341]
MDQSTTPLGGPVRSPLQPKWWHTATVYQVYPRSFCDCNGDGIGDIPGITSKLDYVKKLGIDIIWLSPIYKSPMDDNGYDISDYRDIAPEFGTLADFDQLVAEAKDRGIGIMLDLVVNHTSDEHPWFLQSRQGPDNAFRDFYIWRKPAPDGGPPNRLKSSFGGPAWTLDPATGEYYLHMFSRRQPDLNWENEKVRAEIYDMMNWWLERGIAGFRMDVIDYIGKQADRELVKDGPHLHDYLQEMNAKTFGNRDILTVGEAWSATPGAALLYSGRERRELSMIFQFEHVTQQWDAVYGKWRPKPFDLVNLKTVLSKWQLALSEDGWNSLFWGNHDLPRAVSRYGNVSGYHVESAKMLATVLHLLKGTPFVYQGEEIGMTNVPFTSIEQYRDIETINMHRLHVEAGLSPEEFIRGANENGRDNARTPMQWSAAPHGGFSTGVPWIEVNPNYSKVNAEAAIKDEKSIWNHYRKLIALRKSHPVIIYGEYRSWLDQHPDVFVYTRTLDRSWIIVVANFTPRDISLSLPTELAINGECLICNYEPVHMIGETVELKPYETFAIECK